MKKKFLRVMLCVAMVSSLLAGCGNKTSSTSNETQTAADGGEVNVISSRKGNCNIGCCILSIFHI